MSTAESYVDALYSALRARGIKLTWTELEDALEEIGKPVVEKPVEYEWGALYDTYHFPNVAESKEAAEAILKGWGRGILVRRRKEEYAGVWQEVVEA